MSAISRRAGQPRRKRTRRIHPPRADDPRVVRSRAAVVEAATTLFLQKGYSGTTVEEIAALAGLSRRTVYNNYADKEALFTQIVTDVIDYAEGFARDLRAEFAGTLPAARLAAYMHDLARRLALAILRPEIIALRRLLIGEARSFPGLGKAYFERAPAQVIDALASGFERMTRAGLLRATDARRAAEQFAYLAVGEPLDRAILVGTIPSRKHLIECAREGAATFLARYAVRRKR